MLVLTTPLRNNLLTWRRWLHFTHWNMNDTSLKIKSKMFPFIYFFRIKGIQLQTHELIVRMCLEIVIKGRSDTILLRINLSQTYNLIVWIIDIDIVASTESQLLRQIKNDLIPFIDGHIIRERNIVVDNLASSVLTISVRKFHFHIRILNSDFSSCLCHLDIRWNRAT